LYQETISRDSYGDVIRALHSTAHDHTAAIWYCPDVHLAIPVLA